MSHSKNTKKDVEPLKVESLAGEKKPFRRSAFLLDGKASATGKQLSPRIILIPFRLADEIGLLSSSKARDVDLWKGCDERVQRQQTTHDTLVITKKPVDSLSDMVASVVQKTAHTENQDQQ